MPLLTPDRYTWPLNVLPPDFGTMLSVGPPTSASPRPPDVVVTTSCALLMSATYVDTPPPLRAAPVFRPSTCMRPSLLRPPAPPKTVICGVTWMSVGPPPIVTMPGIKSAVAAQDRAVGIDVSTSLLIVVCLLTLCTSTLGVVADTVKV